jgi:hypothetical protein
MQIPAEHLKFFHSSFIYPFLFVIYSFNRVHDLHKPTFCTFSASCTESLLFRKRVQKLVHVYKIRTESSWYSCVNMLMNIFTEIFHLYVIVNPSDENSVSEIAKCRILNCLPKCKNIFAIGNCSSHVTMLQTAVVHLGSWTEHFCSIIVK